MPVARGAQARQANGAGPPNRTSASRSREEPLTSTATIDGLPPVKCVRCGTGQANRTMLGRSPGLFPRPGRGCIAHGRQTTDSRAAEPSIRDSSRG